jgi:hypothetical protein
MRCSASLRSIISACPFLTVSFLEDSNYIVTARGECSLSPSLISTLYDAKDPYANCPAVMKAEYCDPDRGARENLIY